MNTASTAPAATPLVLLRLEGFALLTAAVFAYNSLGGGWGWFAALLLVPDVSMLGYLHGPRLGAACYNAGHSLIGPALLGGIALASAGSNATSALLVVLIWVAHIGMDRAFGYGLKYADRFGHTHLSV